MIPRSVEYLFKQLAARTLQNEVAMVCSFLEIYNDQIRDLGKAYLVAMGVENSTSSALYDKTSDIFESLAGKRGNPYFAPAFRRADNSEAQKRPGLKEVQDEYNAMNYEIREDAEGNVFVKDLCMVPVSTIEEVMSIIAMGMRVRATHETKMNAFSSRSHTVFTITVLQKDKDSGQSITGMLNLVDLAGSERLKKSESAGVRLKEALHINTSLTALGKVIMALDPGAESTHIPFRDSKLTRVLQNSLGGNSYTTVLANIHPHSNFYEECLSTLQFANRCRSVRNNPRVNYVADNEDKDRKIKRLTDEVKQLRAALGGGGGDGGGGMTFGPGSTGAAGPMGGFVGRRAAAPAMSTPNLVQILKKLGIKADLDPSGAIVLDGKKVDAVQLGLVDSLDGSASEVDGIAGATGDQASGGGGGSGFHHVGSAKGMNPDKMRRIIADLQESNTKMSARTREQKTTIEEQGRSMQELSSEVVKLQTTLVHKDHMYKELEAEKAKALLDQETVMSERFASEAERLASHNKSILLEQQAVIQSVPDTFRSYTTLLRKTNDAKNNFEGPIRREFEKHLATLEKSRKAELDNLRSQYEHWVAEKDRVLESFVGKFNTYRTKKAEQLRMCEKEIVRLHEYTEQIENILDGVEKGKYQVQKKQGLHGRSTTGLLSSQQAMEAVHGHGQTDDDGAYGGVVLPKGLKPTNPLLLPDDCDLGLTKRIVSRHKERMKKLEKVKEEAFHRSLHQASQSHNVTEVDPVLQKQIRDLLISPGSRHPTRAKSAESAVAREPPSNQESAAVAAASPSSLDEMFPVVQQSNQAVKPSSQPPSLSEFIDPTYPEGHSGGSQRSRTASPGRSHNLGRDSVGDSAFGELMLLRAEVMELKASRQIDQVSPKCCRAYEHPHVKSAQFLTIYPPLPTPPNTAKC